MNGHILVTKEMSYIIIQERAKTWTAGYTLHVELTPDINCATVFGVDRFQASTSADFRNVIAKLRELHMEVPVEVVTTRTVTLI